MKRAVITGLGMINALGNDKETFWRNAVAGQCGIGEVDLFDTRAFRTHLGAQVRDLHPADYFSRRMQSRMSRVDQLGLIAAREAMADAGLDFCGQDLERVAIILGAGAGGMESAEKYRRQQLKQTKRLPRPSLLLSFEAAALSDYLGLETGARGYRATIVTACSSSATAIGLGLDLIRHDEADVVITGGAESLCELTYGGFNALRSVDTEPCKPFDLHRKGLSLGEGGGMLVLEESNRAARRQAHIYAEVLGYALSSDAYHMTAPDPKGTGAMNVMRWAITDAGLTLDDIDHISAHGTATRHNDSIECGAIRQLFGDRASRIPVSSLKSMVGHCLGAAGSIEAVALALTIERSVMLPTVNHRTPDPACVLDIVPIVSRMAKVTTALSNSFAFGGNNTALVFGAYHE